jgi:hypothetical protein
MGIVLFYWLAFCFTVAAWLKTIVHLLGGNFIRAALWFNLGVFLLFWWSDKPHDWDIMMPGIVFFTGLGALGTFVRFYRRHKRAAQAVPPLEPAPFEPAPVVNINIKLDISPTADHRALHDELAALASALRGAISTEQGPRRIPGPTIN